MRRGRGWWVVGLMGTAMAGGCQHDKPDINVPLVEEFRAPPNEDRFNNPPEQTYRKPPPKKEFTPGFGGPNGPGGMSGSMPGGR